jgi:hypothetical protein
MDSIFCQADSMTAPLVNLRELLRGLREHQIEYVLTGAAAMIFYGYVRNTEDLDVVVAPDQANLDRVTDWLISLDAVLKLNPQRRFGARERWGLHKGSNATVLTSLGQVDVMQQLPGLPDWPTLVSEAEGYEVEGPTVRVMKPLDVGEAETPARISSRPRRRRGDRAAGRVVTSSGDAYPRSRARPDRPAPRTLAQWRLDGRNGSGRLTVAGAEGRATGRLLRPDDRQIPLG